MESQNHIITEWSRLEGIPGPTALLKQDHLEQVAQDCIQIAFKYL